MTYVCEHCLTRALSKDSKVHHVRALHILAPHVNCEYCFNEALFVLDDEEVRCDPYKQLHLLQETSSISV